MKSKDSLTKKKQSWVQSLNQKNSYMKKISLEQLLNENHRSA